MAGLYNDDPAVRQATAGDILKDGKLWEEINQTKYKGKLWNAVKNEALSRTCTRFKYIVCFRPARGVART